MKRLLVLTEILLAMVLMAGCHCNRDKEEDAAATEQFVERDALQSGDLLMFEVPTDYTIGTGDNGQDTAVSPILPGDDYCNIHVAIVERASDSLFTIDATLKYNTDRHPLDTALAMFTLKNGRLPRIEVMRLKDTSGVAQYVANAKRLLGCRYDLQFDSRNEARYCSELVRDAYVQSGGDTLFALCPLEFRLHDGSIPTYWKELFQLIGTALPQGKTGILPHDIANSDQVKLIGTLQP